MQKFGEMFPDLLHVLLGCIPEMRTNLAVSSVSFRKLTSAPSREKTIVLWGPIDLSSRPEDIKLFQKWAKLGVDVLNQNLE